MELLPLAYSRATATPDLGMSATYTTAHGNGGSSTHRGRPGIEPATQWSLVGFASTAPQKELPQMFFLNYNFLLCPPVSATGCCKKCAIEFTVGMFKSTIHYDLQSLLWDLYGKLLSHIKFLRENSPQ